jgi:hypothetical protein
MSDDTILERTKEWAEDKLLDKTYEFIERNLGTMLTLLIAGTASAFAFLKNHSLIGGILIGAFGTSSVAAFFAFLARRKRLKTSQKSGSDGATEIAAEIDAAPDASAEQLPSRVELPLTVPPTIIAFNYLPASPLNNGWRIAYFDRRFKQEEHAGIEANWRSDRWKVAPDCPREGSIMIDLDNGAFDYDVTRNSYLTRRVEFDAHYVKDSALVFLQVLVATRDGKNTPTKFVKLIIGSNAPYPTPGYEDSEYTVEIEPPAVGHGWRRVVLNLPDVVERSWGQDGWSYKELRKIRLRGKLGISPIELY